MAPCFLPTGSTPGTTTCTDAVARRALPMAHHRVASTHPAQQRREAMRTVRPHDDTALLAGTGVSRDGTDAGAAIVSCCPSSLRGSASRPVLIAQEHAP
ncbi:hypothetical protein [Stenotrophomonas rhizophila]|uniref:hypothetical protein n=1 Tax=Stenotrophomonas rhizophila TaxID=216778 RepID=UPI001E3AE7C6|nr:hypothetical protein [Stenotrophomonas rhizophila]MCC7634859.1 hypothetical protein [Stenotrophomonas rhizophila]MCC7664468.1 hypothetical protein [Stenotrophomonas rhizophila]